MARYMKGILAALAVSMAMLSQSAHADEETGYRKIVSIGCHNTNGTCYVALDGTSFGGSLGCANAPTIEFRFDNGDTEIGKRAYASLLAAYLSGKSVTAHLVGCTSQGLPALAWFRVSD